MKKVITILFFAFTAIYSNAQNVGVGTTTPQAKLSVGASSQFQVDSIGNIKKINNVPTSFPTTQGSNGQTLVNNGSGSLTWNTPNSSEWTYLSKITFSNSSLQQDFTSLLTHDKWKLVFTIHNNGSSNSDRIIVGAGINGITSAYQYAFHNNGNIAYYAGVPNWTIYNSAADDFDSFMGETIIAGKPSTTQFLKSFYSTGAGGLISGNIAMNGRLSGDAANVSSINIIPTNPITGTVELWFKDNQ
jgi:hypothetical protein